MNKITLEGNWNMLKGKIKEKWGKITDDDLMRINGKREQLMGELQRKYGYIRAKAEEEISSWEKNLNMEHHTSDRNQMHGQENQHSQMDKQKAKQKR